MKNSFNILIIDLILISTFFSCSQKRETFQNENESNVNFQKINVCEETVNTAEIDYKLHRPYVLKDSISENFLSVDFKFISACCMAFEADYEIKEDILFLTFKQSNDVVCSCYCWYNYHVEITNIEGEFKNYKMNGYNRLYFE